MSAAIKVKLVSKKHVRSFVLEMAKRGAHPFTPVPDRRTVVIISPELFWLNSITDAWENQVIQFQRDITLGDLAQL